MHGGHCVLHKAKRKLYYGGGDAQGNVKCKVLEFDLLKFKWQELSPYMFERFAMAVVCNKLILLGGFNPTRDEYVDRVSEWKESGCNWIKLSPPLTSPRCDASAIGFKKWLIVAGGFDSSPLDCVEMLDCENFHHWHTLSPLPKPAYGLQSTAYVDGTTALWYLMTSSVSVGIKSNRPVYAVSLNQLTERGRASWSVLPDPPLVDSGAVTMRGYLLAVGGRDKHTTRSEVHMYFPGTYEWLNVGSLEYPRHSICCVPLSDRKFVILGGHDERDLSTNVDQYNMS